MFVFVVVVGVDVMYGMLCTTNKYINIEYYYNKCHCRGLVVIDNGYHLMVGSSNPSDNNKL